MKQEIQIVYRDPDTFGLSLHVAVLENADAVQGNLHIERFMIEIAYRITGIEPERRKTSSGYDECLNYYVSLAEGKVKRFVAGPGGRQGYWVHVTEFLHTLYGI